MYTSRSPAPTSPLLAAFEAAWEAIRHHHPDLPDAVIRLGQGHDPRHPGRLVRGHWAASTWQVGTAAQAEVMIAGERLADGAEGVLSTLLHEAAHGLATARGIADTSRQGRYHNSRYRRLAEELLLAVERHPVRGWTLTRLTEAARERYASSLDAIAQALPGYRRIVAGSSMSPRRRRPGRRRFCRPCGRVLYMAPGVAELGPVLCGACDGAFQAADRSRKAATFRS